LVRQAARSSERASHTTGGTRVQGSPQRTAPPIKGGALIFC